MIKKGNMIKSIEDIHPIRYILNSLLVSTVRGGDIEEVRTILDSKKENIEQRDSRDMTPLMYAASAGNEEITGLLLDRGADIEAKNQYGTALMYAAIENQKKIFKLLLYKGANIKAENDFGKNCFDMAITQGYMDIFSCKEAKKEKGNKSQSVELDNPATSVVTVKNSSAPLDQSHLIKQSNCK